MARPVRTQAIACCRFSSIEARNSWVVCHGCIGADEQREVLGHLAAFDSLDADALERLGEVA